MTIFGVSVGGFSVGLFNLAAFGLDPFQVFAHGLYAYQPIGFGTFYMLLNLLMLVFVFFWDRTKIGVCTFINIFLLGYAVEFSSWLFGQIWLDPDWMTRVILLLLAILILCFGAAFYYVGDLGVSTYDAIALTLAERTKIKFAVLRVITDVLCTAVGFLLGATAGVATVINAFCMGPLIAFFRKRFAEPFRYGKSVPDAPAPGVPVPLADPVLIPATDLAEGDAPAPEILNLSATTSSVRPNNGRPRS